MKQIKEKEDKNCFKIASKGIKHYYLVSTTNSKPAIEPT